MINFYNNFEKLDIPLYGVKLPKFKIEEKHRQKYKFSEEDNNFGFLKTLTWEGLEKLNIPQDKIPEYTKRANYELNIINELGFVDYFLLVWDVINFCKENDIPTGAGRGSASGSCVLFLIGVTKVDSLKYGLFFERFISKTRAKKLIINGETYFEGKLLPDVDLDIDYFRRGEVIKYIEEKFEGKTSKIVTFNTLSGRLLIKEVGKIVGDKSETEMNLVSPLITKVFGSITDIEDVYKNISEFKEWCDKNKEIYEISLKLRDLIKNKGVHPSALLISEEKLQDFCPFEASKNDICCSYDMEWASAISIKLDLLGLRSVSVIDECCKMAGIKVEDIDIEDNFIYQQLQDLKHPHGIFQIEADTNYRICQKVKPKNIEELSAVLALARPGALEFVEQYAAYSNFGELQKVHDYFDDILKETGGNCLYQETQLKMLNKIGFDLDSCEQVRRILGKKETEKVKEWELKIKNKVKENNLSPEIGEILWKIINDSAKYSFNKCLSPDTRVETVNGLKTLSDIQVGEEIKAYDVINNKDHFVKIKNKYNNKVKLIKMTLSSINNETKIIKCSIEHKFLCNDKKMHSLFEILCKDLQIFNHYIKFVDDVIGLQDTLDLEVDHPDHNFYANGIITSNSHSISYSKLSAITIYLKFKYPKEFFTSLLKIAKDEPDYLEEISAIQREMQHFNIKLLPPHILKSDLDFKVEESNIRYGLLAIKGISEKSKEKLNEFKHVYKNKFEVFEGAKRAGLTIGGLSAIIQSGGLEDFNQSRAKTVLECHLWNILTDKEKQTIMNYGEEFKYNLIDIIKHLNTVKSEKAKPIILDKRLETIKKKYEPYKQIYLLNSKSEKLCNYFYEKKLLGFSYSSNLFDIYREECPNLIKIQEVKNSIGKRVLFIGEVKQSIISESKVKKTKYLKIRVEDEKDFVNALVFKDEGIDACKNLNNGKLPKEEDVVIVRGLCKSEDGIFADTISIQSAKIYMKLSELE